MEDLEDGEASSSLTNQEVSENKATCEKEGSETSTVGEWRGNEEEEGEDEIRETKDCFSSTTSSTDSSNDELEVAPIFSLEQQLEQFRIQWRREVDGDEEGESQNGKSDAIKKEKEKEQEALFLYRQGVREEKRGNMYSAVMLYRRAMQLVPDIESRMPELREMKKSYRRRRRRASSGGSTSEQEANSETKGQSGTTKDGEEEQEKTNGQETIIEEETTSPVGNLQSSQNGEAEKCFTVLDSDDFGQKEEVGSPVADLLSPGGQFLSPASHQGSSGSERKLASIDPDCQQTAQPEKEVIPPGTNLIEYITTKRSRSSDSGDKLSCQPEEKVEDGSTHLSHLPPEILFYILQWVVSEDCDVRSLERLSSVCRGFYLFARDKDLWKLLCHKMWTLDCKSPKVLGYETWRHMYIRRPHPIFDGIYIAKTSYVRQGEQALGNSYRHWQLVEYFRYIRLFSDGFMFMLTTCDDPLTTIPKIKSRTTKYPGLMTGYYRSIDCDDGKERLSAVLTRAKTTTIAPSRRPRRGVNVNYADQEDRSFHMELEMLCSGKKRLHSQLKWRSFSVHSMNHSSGETNVSDFDLTSNSYPDLFFSRVKSYALSSTKPIQL